MKAISSIVKTLYVLLTKIQACYKYTLFISLNLSVLFYQSNIKTLTVTDKLLKHFVLVFNLAPDHVYLHRYLDDDNKHVKCRGYHVPCTSNNVV